MLPDLREFVNYRHPDPRRVWKGGSEQQLVTPFPVDPLESSGSAGSGGLWGVCQTSVSSTRNTTFASGNPLPPQAAARPSPAYYKIVIL